MKKVKKAQTGVQTSKKDMNKHPEDFKFLRTSEKAGGKTVTKKVVKKVQNGVGIPPVSLDKAKCGGMIKPKDKNVTKSKKQATFKSGGKMKTCKGGC